MVRIGGGSTKFVLSDIWIVYTKSRKQLLHRKYLLYETGCISDAFNNHFANIRWITSSSVPESDVSFKTLLPPQLQTQGFFFQFFVIIFLKQYKISLQCFVCISFKGCSRTCFQFVYSINTGIFPEGLKVSKTVPIYKGRDAGPETNIKESITNIFFLLNHTRNTRS